MDTPFRDDSAVAERIARLEEEARQLRAELAAAEAALPENGTAYYQQLVRANEELRRAKAHLEKELEGFQPPEVGAS